MVASVNCQEDSSCRGNHRVLYIEGSILLEVGFDKCGGREDIFVCVVFRAGVMWDLRGALARYLEWIHQELTYISHHFTLSPCEVRQKGIRWGQKTRPISASHNLFTSNYLEFWGWLVLPKRWVKVISWVIIFCGFLPFVSYQKIAKLKDVFGWQWLSFYQVSWLSWKKEKIKKQILL